MFFILKRTYFRRFLLAPARFPSLFRRPLLLCLDFLTVRVWRKSTGWFVIFQLKKVKKQKKQHSNQCQQTLNAEEKNTQRIPAQMHVKLRSTGRYLEYGTSKSTLWHKNPKEERLTVLSQAIFVSVTHKTLLTAPLSDRKSRVCIKHLWFGTPLIGM